MGDPDSTRDIPAGADVTIVKLRPDGSQAASYQGVAIDSPPGWVVARAEWAFPRMDLDYMVFEPGDYLYEYFPTSHPFNAFVLFSSSDALKGWYCNVTHPTTVEGTTIYWHDLYVDVVQKADGTILVLDEDELAESDLMRIDPGLHAMITSARDLVVEKMRTSAYPFSAFPPLIR
jgi:hypothetical protein